MGNVSEKSRVKRSDDNVTCSSEEKQSDYVFNDSDIFGWGIDDDRLVLNIRKPAITVVLDISDLEFIKIISNRLAFKSAGNAMFEAISKHSFVKLTLKQKIVKFFTLGEYKPCNKQQE